MLPVVERRLLLLSAAAAVAATGCLMCSTEGTTVERATLVLHVAQSALDHGVWGYATRAAVVAMGVAVFLSGTVALLGTRERHADGIAASQPQGSVRERVVETAERVRRHILGEKSDVVGALDELIRGALAVEASDIHISPTPEGLKLTYRVHGTLYELARFELGIAQRLATRVKVLARMETHIRGTPQDGRLVTTIDKTIIDARVSTLPTEHGERVVLRLVRGGRSIPDLETLGFSNHVVQGIRSLLARPQGILFMTAPVGSGKTTTLYAAMKHIADTRGRTTTMVTLEDPIELELPFATQTQMHRRAGMTFAATLRSVLRQDPNVLMLGEIRDRETAEVAMQAGLTGHLILTTVHGDTAAGPFARIIDMNVESFVIASATIGCLSQRLVRTLCMACRRASPPTPLAVARFEQLGVVLSEHAYFEAVGCDYCEMTGFSGRRPIAELLVVDDALRKAVHEARPTREIYDLALSAGMTPLLHDGLRRAEKGETSLSEVLRVAG